MSQASLLGRQLECVHDIFAEVTFNCSVLSDNCVVNLSHSSAVGYVTSYFH